ncbi:MAG: hypothetical protein V2B20_14895 [Pseudomonadota bacterium]
MAEPNSGIRFEAGKISLAALAEMLWELAFEKTGTNHFDQECERIDTIDTASANDC